MKKLNLKLDLPLKIFVLFVFIIICILIGFIVVTIKDDNVSISEYNSYLKFSYPSNFTISESEDNINLFSSDKEAIIVLKKIDYTSTSKTKEQSDLAESLSYQVINDDNYILTYNNSDTKNDKTRYYYLFENYEDKKQIEVITIFDEDYIYVVIYEAKNSEFDLYTESINIIIDSLEG